MANDWKVGDAVVCVRKPTGDYPSDWEPKVGSIYEIYGFDVGGNNELLLDLAEDPECGNEYYAWEAAAFKKLRPAEDEFTALIRAMKPAKQGADA